jgi:hypothetical protein
MWRGNDGRRNFRDIVRVELIEPSRWNMWTLRRRGNDGRRKFGGIVRLMELTEPSRWNK